MDSTTATPQDAPSPTDSAPAPASPDDSAQGTPPAQPEQAPAKSGKRGRAAQADAAAAAFPAPETIAPSIEAVLLTSERPVSAQRLAEALGLLPSGEDKPSEGETAPSRALRKGATDAVAKAVEHLNGEYEKTGRSFRIEQIAGGYRFMTLPRFAQVIEAFKGSRAKSTLSHAALETLAIIAYKQPVTRAQLEAIRGVATGEVLRTLIDRRLVTIAGRAEELGRPLLYGTTKHFLELFGLSSIKDLPSVEELKARAAGKVEE